MIVERSRTWRTVEGTAIAIETACRQSHAVRTAGAAIDIVRRLAPAQRIRLAGTFTASAAAVYIVVGSTLPVHAKALVPFAAIVLVLVCATAFALPFRE